MRKHYIGGLVGLFLITGCSIFERPTPSSEKPQELKKLEHQQSELPDLRQINTGGSIAQPQLRVIDNESQSTEKFAPKQIKEPGAELPNKQLPNKELLDKHRVSDLGTPATKINRFQRTEIASLCKQLSDKLFSLSLDQCLNLRFSANALSVLRRPLVHQDFINANPANAPRKRVLIIGGIHGDEYSSTSVVFKWMAMIQENGHSIFDWRFLPSANPDGLLRNKPQRQNANNVDLNRNFLTQDWYEQATSKWRSKYNSDPRRFPGNGPASEPEVKWIVQQIKDFNPDAIISLHAPYGRVDFDGPPEGPTKLGALTAIRLGVFPGSLGNYTGVDLKIPTVTLELPSADKIPAKLEISSMWQDLQIWLCNHLEERCDAAAMPNGSGALDPVDVVNNQ